MLRAPMRIAGRRYESSTAGTAASKAQQGLSKVTSAAGPAIAGAARGVGNALSKIGGRTGRLINFVQGAFASLRLLLQTRSFQLVSGR